MYDWHQALVDEQRSRALISLTIYPFLNDHAPSSSFEASSSLLVASNIEGDMEDIRLEELARLEHQSTKCCLEPGLHLSSSTLPFTSTNGNHSTAAGTRKFEQLSSASNVMSQRQSGSSIAYDDLQLYREPPTSSTQLLKPQSDEQVSQQPPIVSIKPSSQLIFAPWNYKKKSGKSEVFAFLCESV